MLWTALDIPVAILWLIMALTLWRAPTLARIWKHHRGDIWHSRIGRTFVEWVWDIPFVILACTVMPWRMLVMGRYLWSGGGAIPGDRFDIFKEQVYPWQRNLILRFALLSVYDLLSLAASPVLLILPWRLRQVCALARYERFCARGKWSGFPSWRLLSHENKALQLQYRQQTYAEDGKEAGSRLPKPGERRNDLTSHTPQLSEWTRACDSVNAVVLPLVFCGVVDIIAFACTLLAFCMAPWLSLRMYRETNQVLQSVRGGSLFGLGLAAGERTLYSLKIEQVAYSGCVRSGGTTGITMGGAVVVNRSSERLISRLDIDGTMGYWSDGKGGLLQVSDVVRHDVENNPAEVGAADASEVQIQIGDADDETERLVKLTAVELLEAEPLFAFAPRVTGSFWWPLAKGWLLQAFLDLPHLLVLPFKLLALVLTPVHWYLTSRLGNRSPLPGPMSGPKVKRDEMEMQPEPEPEPEMEGEPEPEPELGLEAELEKPKSLPNLSWFLTLEVCGKHTLAPGPYCLWVSHHSTSLRSSHERGLALLLAFVLLILDTASTILFVMHLIFPLVLTLFSPVWKTTRMRLQFYKLGRLTPASPRWLEALHGALVLIQFVGGPLFFLWVLWMITLPAIVKVLIGCPSYIESTFDCVSLDQIWRLPWWGFGSDLRLNR